ncbi:hypothetical protein PtrM4_130540 [Pyrenophora tritici-repentis]|uniref:Uncharacterized protein n=2 Tax=Pyrenophora tritici-repentis TaxID=45151 RepID=A0A834RRF7_9PLEO|nr:uncharacterized protein PTRG_10788 [Pyrenophora tritici-repentis Pt-1C-BFP]EDU43838.1 hypothetical protein PTRG_10788 [Pyrenophora tritici-repentis Pt-1C-BFP]KAF7568441.1 hypothetical protein PtrM4_130540 [Pyrenophora tritici-repentis]
MRHLSTTLLLSTPLLAFAKDCAVYYSFSNSAVQDYNTDRNTKSLLMCKDIGGDIEEAERGLVNGAMPFVCSVCRGARDSTADYEEPLFLAPGEWVTFTVRCGDFGYRKCHK